jgi:superfamily II DNA or RNA helicase
VTQASMKAASEKSHIVGDVVENYIKYAFGKRAVCFATDVATSAKIAAQFNAWGIPAASISAETDSGVRDDVIRRLRDGRLWVVCNVDLLGEGFDLPAIECVIMARPTASLAVYMQQFGRALRPMPGKLFGLVIDHVSNIKRFGFPDRPRVWSLDRRQKRAAKEKDPELVDVLICPNTGRPYEAIHIAACPHCKQADGVTPGNHTKPAGAGGSVRAIEVVAGDLTRLTADQLAELRKAMQLPDPNAVVDPRWSGGVQAGQRNIAFANIQAQRELQEAIAEWAGYQKHGLGRDDSELFRRFYHATGLDVLSALAGSRQDMIAMTERVRGWLTMAA